MLLLYCMIEDDLPLRCSGMPGVDGAPLQDVAKNGVRYLYSQWRAARNADEVKQQAIEFHRTTQRVLESATLIPFRFPTSVTNEHELAELAEAQSSEYALELQRLHGMVQMKVSIEGSSHASATVSTGTEYLKQRQQANEPMNTAVEKIKHAAHGLTSEVKQSRRGGGTNLFLLLEREEFEKLRGALQQIEGLTAKVSFSGPWPPSEFINCYPEHPVDRH